MSDAKFPIKQNDTMKTLRGVLLDGDGHVVILVGDESLKFHMALPNKPPKIDAAAMIEDVTYKGNTVKGFAYYWIDGDTDTVGEYKAEIEVTFAGGGVQTFPTVGFFTISISKELA